MKFRSIGWHILALTSMGPQLQCPIPWSTKLLSVSSVAKTFSGNFRNRQQPDCDYYNSSDLKNYSVTGIEPDITDVLAVKTEWPSQNEICGSFHWLIGSRCPCLAGLLPRFSLCRLRVYGCYGWVASVSFNAVATTENTTVLKY